MSKIFSQGYAVIVGVGADLAVTVDDANAIAQTLIDPARCAYPEDQVRLLTSEQANRDNMISALEWLSISAGENDTAILYFSGHGIETPDYYFVPYGFDWQGLTDTAISGEEFTKRLQSIKAQKLLVLLDCCHAGGLAEAKNYTKSPLPYSAIEELGSSRGRVVMASSRKNELSWTGSPYSQFTMALLEALAGYGAFEQDGFARVLDLAIHVGRVVPNRTNNEQHPLIKVSNLKDNYAIAWYAAGDSTPKRLSWETDASYFQSIQDNAQTAAWLRMLANYRYSLLLIEERMSQFVEFSAIPLQYMREKEQTEKKIKELESRLQER